MNFILSQGPCLSSYSSTCDSCSVFIKGDPTICTHSSAIVLCSNSHVLWMFRQSSLHCAITHAGVPPFGISISASAHASESHSRAASHVASMIILPDVENRVTPLPSDVPKKKERVGRQQKHTTGGIPRWSPTLVLVARFSAYVWQSGRDAQFSLTCGRVCSHRLSQRPYM